MKKENAIYPKFAIGDKVYYISRKLTEVGQIYYCPECHGRGKVDVEFPQYQTTTLAICPLCHNRFGIGDNEIDKSLGNHYRRCHSVGAYTVSSGIITGIYCEVNKTGISSTFLVKNDKHPGDSMRMAETDLYASKISCVTAIVKKNNKEKTDVDIYIGKKNGGKGV